MQYRWLGLVAFVAACSARGPHLASDASLLADAAALADAAHDAASSDAAPPADAAIDASLDAPPDAGAGPPLTVSTTDLDLGIADIGQTLSPTITLTNPSTVKVTVTYVVAGDPAVRDVSGCSVIYPGTSCDAYVDYLPYASGLHQADITIHAQGATSEDFAVHAHGDTYTALTVGTWGGGAITAPAIGLSCSGAGCATRFTGDVTLSESPAAGNTFVAWSDPTCGSQPTCTAHRDALARTIKANFAPSSSVVLSLTLSGPGEVQMAWTPPGSAPMTAWCRASCQVPLYVGAQIEVSTASLVDTVGLSGACSGTRSCTFTASTSTSLTATFHTDAKELWDRELESTPVVGAAYNSHGDLVLVTNAFQAGAMKLIELDPSGKTIWVHPEALGQEVRIGSSDTVLLRRGNDAWVYDANGYLLGDDSFPEVETSSDVPEYHYPRRLAVLANGDPVMVGTASGTTVKVLGGWTRTIAAPSLESVRATDHVYVGVGDMTGTSSVAVFDGQGMAGTTFAAATAHQPLGFDVLPGGDLVTTSGSASEVTLRRISAAGTTVFTHTVPLTYAAAPYAGVVAVSGGRVLWSYSASGPSGLSGFVADVVDATGNVQWAIDRPSDADGRGVEVYDVASQGSAAAVVGGYFNFVATEDGSTTQGVQFGEGFVEAFQP